MGFSLRVNWGPKGICAKCLCYKWEYLLQNGHILAITLIVYNCISVKYRKYKADIDDYSRRVSFKEWEGSELLAFAVRKGV